MTRAGIEIEISMLEMPQQKVRKRGRYPHLGRYWGRGSLNNGDAVLAIARPQCRVPPPRRSSQPIKQQGSKDPSVPEYPALAKGSKKYAGISSMGHTIDMPTTTRAFVGWGCTPRVVPTASRRPCSVSCSSTQRNLRYVSVDHACR